MQLNLFKPSNLHFDNYKAKSAIWRLSLKDKKNNTNIYIWK